MHSVVRISFVLAALVLSQQALAPGVLAQQAVTGAPVPCADGVAAGFPCHRVDLMAFLPIADLGGERTVGPDSISRAATLNDIWGWTDPATGREYALVGRSDGTAFVDVTDPANPVFLGRLPLPVTARPSTWRDVKVYADHAFVVADNAGAHGMQVFDLRRLRTVDAPPVLFTETTRYTGFETAHNVVVDEATGYAYVVGIRGRQVGACGPGLHFVDVRDPADPQYAGCFADLTTGRSGDGYTHDAQCVVYRGPDADYQGREICFAANETAVSIADVTDKNHPIAVATTAYPNASYVHQGWLTDDQRYFFVDDETDEIEFGFNTRTIICDLEDLDEPVCAGVYVGALPSSDHNQYVVGGLSFQANYKSGLRLLDVRDPLQPVEVGHFDTHPRSDASGYDGAWSSYPFFASGNVVVSSIREGLFVLRPAASLRDIVSTGWEETPAGVPAPFALAAPYPNPFNPSATVALTVDAAQPVRLVLFDVLGRPVAVVHDGPLVAGTHRFTVEAGDLPGGTYLLRARGASATATRTLTLLK